MDTSGSFFDRYFDPLTSALSVEGAKSLLELQPDEAVVRRVAELGERSNSGLLTTEERQEYRLLADAGTLISILKAKARRTLADRPA